MKGSRNLAQQPASNIMHKSLILILAMLATVCLANDETVPTRRIVSEDILQDSLKLWQFSTNRFGVMWTYTEPGAKKFLAFLEAHEGKTMRTVIGGFESRPHVWEFTPNYIS